MSAISILTKVVVFRLDEQRYAAPLAEVERVIPAVEITALPNAPAIVFGVINVAGIVMPVINLRRRFRVKERGVSPADQFLIVHASRRMVALVIDEVLGLLEYMDEEIIRVTQVVPGVDQIHGLIKHPDGLVLIHDLEKLLSLDEDQVLESALNQEVPRGT